MTSEHEGASPEVPTSTPPRRPSGAPSGRGKVLVVDDEAALRRSVARILMSRGFDVDTAEDGLAALDLLKARAVDVILLDLMMPKMGGMEVLAKVRKDFPDVAVIMMTAFGDIDTAVAAVRAGAYDFLAKPFPSADAMVHVLEKAAEHRRLVDKTRQLEERLEQHEKFGELIGTSSRMQEVYRLALGVAPTQSTVLILGENGTGKELVARAIHQHSTRAHQPLRVVNCGAIPENLVETELFGCVRGAFTGALDKPGLFELADKGTVFLDEIGDLPSAAQVKLLRALAQGEIRRVGSNDNKIVDVRVLAATNVDLKERIQQNRFREDLYYRLSVIPINLPKLAQRKDDIPLLAYHFLQKYTRRAGRDIKRISVEALKQLRDQPWPGNVRELENAVEYAVVMSRSDVIMPQDLPFSRAAAELAAEPGDAGFFGVEIAELAYAEAKNRAIDAFDCAYLERVMKRAGNNVSEAARQAGMDRSNFRRLLKKARSKDDGEGDD